MLWTLILGAALAAQAPERAPAQVGGGPAPTHWAGASASSTLGDAELEELEELEALGEAPAGVRGRRERPLV